MKRYTSLKQAVHDPALVIITENVATLGELNRAYIRYGVLPGNQRRFSNYYSNKFLGRSVPEMYTQLKDKMEADYDIFKDVQLPVDKYAISEPDLYYKEASFNSGETNICFILGHSGSGKSMMARMLEGEGIIHIELDDLLLVKDHFTMDELYEYSDMLSSFFTGAGLKYYIGAAERDLISKEEYEDKVFIDFVKFAMEYSKAHPEKRYIIEGIWIYLYFEDPSVFKDYAVFIKGTSFLKSKIRTMKREMQRDRDELEDRRQMFGREVRNYLLDEDKINIYRDYFGSSPNTIFREENNEAAKIEEIIRNELVKIDECFVKADANGMIRIIKNAASSEDLPAEGKLKIINECKSAMRDLDNLIERYIKKHI